MVSFDIWDLDRVNIKVESRFLSEINKKIASKFKTKRMFHKAILSIRKVPFTTFKNLLKPSNMKKFFVPLEIYLRTVEGLDIPKNDLQKSIIAYKTGNGINHIKNPILPISINPVFHMLFAHNLADGTVINPKKGRLPYFGYRQFDEFYRISYVEKVEFVFGKIYYAKDYAKKTTRVYLPPVVSTLFFKFYKLGVDGFLSRKTRIPSVVLNSGKDSILAVLIAFIIDEGHIDSTQITIGLKNKLLIEDLKEICGLLGYHFTVKEGRGEYLDYGYLYILRKGMKKLHGDYLSLNKRYPVIDLGWKGEKIRKSFEISNRVIIRTKGNKELIMSILRNENLSVNQLADRINMTRQGVRYHIHNLLKDDKINVTDNKQLNWIYGV